MDSPATSTSQPSALDWLFRILGFTAMVAVAFTLPLFPAMPLTGPIFNPRVHDWPKHEAKIATFWSSVMLQSGTYHGRPMPAHAPLPVGSGHFDHWLKLFGEAARDVCPPEQAAMFVERANAIAQSLEFGVATFRGQILDPGKRLKAPDA